MESHLTRRRFLQTAGTAAAGAVLAGCQTLPRRISANEKLNLGVIGTANRAAGDLKEIAGENIVALCDIDDKYLAAAKEKFPRAKIYNDFRRLIHQREIDAILVATADHTHAVATMAALKSGRHVYCEKPLTHTVWEARQIANYAAQHKKLATQMGTQIHAGNNYRRVVELVQSGAIGAVNEVHVWCEKSVTAPSDKLVSTPPVPKNVHWDLWLGPASARPYSPALHPRNWRHWWNFGGGTLADMACHYIDLAFWALKLRCPATIQAEGPPVNSEITPTWLVVNWEFPARENLPPVRLTWYDGGKRPALVEEGKISDQRNGVLFIGEKGMLLADYDSRILLPEKDFADFKAPEPTITDSIGHHAEWIRACKTGASTTCNFDYAAALTETVLLGNVAFRSGEKLEWDAASLKFKNSATAMNYLRTEYRKDWSL